LSTTNFAPSSFQRIIRLTIFSFWLIFPLLKATNTSTVPPKGFHQLPTTLTINITFLPLTKSRRLAPDKFPIFLSINSQSSFPSFPFNFQLHCHLRFSVYLRLNSSQTQTHLSIPLAFLLSLLLHKPPLF